MEDAHFGIYHRVYGVRSKGHGGFPLHFLIAGHTRAAAFLVQPQQQPYPALCGVSGFLYGGHGIQSGYGRSLVINGAPAEELSVMDLRTVRGEAPACAFGHHIQMPHDGQHLFALTVFDHTAAVLYVPDIFKAQIPGYLLHLHKSLLHIPAVGHIFFRFPAGNGGDADKRLQILHFFFKGSVNNGFHMFLLWNSYPQYTPSDGARQRKRELFFRRKHSMFRQKLRFSRILFTGCLQPAPSGKVQYIKGEAG